jgi:serine/threonine protein kinase
MGKVLGGGTFAKVKRTVHTVAEHDITNERVAIKILNRKEMHDSKMLHKVRREIKIMKLFHHPHIIRL